MAAANGGTSNGTVVWQTTCNGLVQQEWKFVPVTSASAPTISTVSPNSGPTAGGTVVTVTGTNFSSPASVMIGGTAATNVLVSSSTEITANTPAGNAGPVTVGVNQGSQSTTMANAFNYVAPAKQTITFVQGNYSVPQGNVSTVAVPFTSAQTASDMNVVVVGWNDSTSKVNSVVDTLGNVYALAGTTIMNGSASQSIYYAKNILGATGGANTVTVTFDAAAFATDVQILEYAGADTTSPLDVFAGASGNSAASSVSLTTTFSGDIIVGANVVQTVTTGPGSGFTERLLSSPDGDVTEDKEATSLGSYTASASLSATGYWVATAAAFKASSGTPPPPTYGISGTVNGSPTAVSMALAGPSSSTVSTSSTGSYTFSGLSNGAYTVTPSENGYTFNPVNATATIKNGSVTGLNFTAASTTAPPHSASLSWVASTSSNVVGYKVYRATGTSTNYAQIASGVVSSTYMDTNVTDGFTYNYAVTAVDNNGNESAYSNIAAATIPTT